MNRALACLAAFIAAPALASLPPPPPQAASDAAKILADPSIKDVAKIAPLFAADVVASENGRTIAKGKTAWLSWWNGEKQHDFGRLIAWAGGRDGDDATLLVIDEFDTIDNFSKPPPPGDPRWSTRTVFYRFGSDGLIHFVQIATVNSIPFTKTW